MNSTGFRITATALIAAGTFLGTAAPAAFADTAAATPQPASRAAAVIERITGTADIARDLTGVAPATASGKVKAATADGSVIAIGLPAVGSAAAVTSAHGTVVYPGATGSTSLAVQPTEDGFRALIAIADASAPKEYRFGLDLPAGAAALQQGDGSVLIVKDGETVGQFEAPWAKDANGAGIATSYRLENGALVQSVAFDAHTAFPVVADPTVKGLKKRAKAALVNSNVSTVAGAAGGCVVGAVAAAGAGCGPGAAVGALGGFIKGASEGFIRGH